MKFLEEKVSPLSKTRPVYTVETSLIVPIHCLVHDSNRNEGIKLYSTLACFIPANARTVPAEKAKNMVFLFAEKA